MKKTVLVLAVAVMVLGTMSVAFAAADVDWSPAKFFAQQKGITEEAAYQLRREEGKSFGELAQDQGVFEGFREQALEQRKLMLAEMVKEEVITQEKADEVLTAIEDCDGTMEQQRLLQETGLFGQGGGFGQGAGNGLKAMDGEGFGAKEGGYGQGGGQMRRGGRN